MLLEFDQLEDQAVRTEINRVTAGYKDKSEFFVDKLAQGVAMIGRHSTRRTFGSATSRATSTPI